MQQTYRASVEGLLRHNRVQFLDSGFRVQGLGFSLFWGLTSEVREPSWNPDELTSVATPEQARGLGFRVGRFPPTLTVLNRDYNRGYYNA